MLYPKDPGVKVEHSGGNLTITWIWSRATGVMFGIFALTFIALVVTMAFTPTKTEEPRTLRESLIAFGLFSFMWGPALYASLAFLTNKTVLTANAEVIDVRSGPIPAARNKRFSAVGIKQFFASSLGSSSSSRSSTTSPNLYVMDSEDHAHVLGGTFPSTFALHQVRHELQDFYQQKDQEIYGFSHKVRPGSDG